MRRVAGHRTKKRGRRAKSIKNTPVRKEKHRGEKERKKKLK